MKEKKITAFSGLVMLLFVAGLFITIPRSLKDQAYAGDKQSSNEQQHHQARKGGDFFLFHKSSSASNMISL